MLVLFGTLSPGEMLVEKRWPLISGMPDLERLRIAVDDPVFRHRIALKRSAFGRRTSSVVQRRGRTTGMDIICSAARRRGKRPCGTLWLSVRRHVIISTPVGPEPSRRLISCEAPKSSRRSSDRDAPPIATSPVTTLQDQLRRALGETYTIDREIGRGGMATVFPARDEKHHRNVALKVLDPELGAVLGAERFLSEIRVTAALQHEPTACPPPRALCVDR
jgi:hypothetical protein